MPGTPSVRGVFTPDADYITFLGSHYTGPRRDRGIICTAVYEASQGIAAGSTEITRAALSDA